MISETTARLMVTVLVNVDSVVASLGKSSTLRTWQPGQKDCLRMFLLHRFRNALYKIVPPDATTPLTSKPKMKKKRQ